MMILWCFYGVAMMIPGFLFFIVNSNGVLMGQESPSTRTMLAVGNN